MLTRREGSYGTTSGGRIMIVCQQYFKELKNKMVDILSYFGSLRNNMDLFSTFRKQWVVSIPILSNSSRGIDKNEGFAAGARSLE